MWLKFEKKKGWLPKGRMNYGQKWKNGQFFSDKNENFHFSFNFATFSTRSNMNISLKNVNIFLFNIKKKNFFWPFVYSILYFDHFNFYFYSKNLSAENSIGNKERLITEQAVNFSDRCKYFFFKFYVVGLRINLFFIDLFLIEWCLSLVKSSLLKISEIKKNVYF